jgi:DNA-binding CsgD family transcriptional regulator
VDPHSGYGYFDMNQVEEARVVALLRRGGVPVAEVRSFVGSPSRESEFEHQSKQRREPQARRVVALVAQHLTNPEIAQRMFVSTATVKSHLNGVFSKLGVQGRHQLAKLAASKTTFVEDGETTRDGRSVSAGY